MIWRLLKGNLTWLSDEGYRVEGSIRAGFTTFAPGTSIPIGLSTRLATAKTKAERHYKEAVRA